MKAAIPIEEITRASEEQVRLKKQGQEIKQMIKDMDADSALSKKIPDFLKKMGWTQPLDFEQRTSQDFIYSFLSLYREFDEEVMEWLNEKDDISTDDVGREVLRDRYYGDF